MFHFTCLWTTLYSSSFSSYIYQFSILFQGSKLAVANLPPVKNVGSKNSLPGNSVMKIIFWKKKLIFTEIILLFIRQNTIPCGQRHYQCL